MKKQMLLNALDGGGCYPAFVAHFANISARNIFNKWYKAPGIIVIDEQTDSSRTDLRPRYQSDERQGLLREGNLSLSYNAHRRCFGGIITDNMQAKVIQIANLTEAKRSNPQRRRVYWHKGISPCLNGIGRGGNLEPMFLWIEPK